MWNLSKDFIPKSGPSTAKLSQKLGFQINTSTFWLIWYIKHYDCNDWWSQFKFLLVSRWFSLFIVYISVTCKKPAPSEERGHSMTSNPRKEEREAILKSQSLRRVLIIFSTFNNEIKSVKIWLPQKYLEQRSKVMHVTTEN